MPTDQDDRLAAGRRQRVVAGTAVVLRRAPLGLEQILAEKAMQRRTGARGLRTILENVLLETMYELPSLRNVQKVVVDETVMLGESKPYIVYGPGEEGRLSAVEERRPTGSDH